MSYFLKLPLDQKGDMIIVNLERISYVRVKMPEIIVYLIDGKTLYAPFSQEFLDNVLVRKM